MTRNELLAAIEEATDATLSAHAAHDPQDAAEELEYRARECDVRAERLNTLTTLDAHSQEVECARQLRDLAAGLRGIINQQEAA